MNLTNETEDVTLEINDGAIGLWLMMHNNQDGQNLMDYQELTICLTISQVKELSMFLHKYIEENDL